MMIMMMIMMMMKKMMMMLSYDDNDDYVELRSRRIGRNGFLPNSTKGYYRLITPFYMMMVMMFICDKL
jgi:hypothetical protein